MDKIGRIQKAALGLAIASWLVAALASVDLLALPAGNAGWVGLVWGVSLGATATSIYAGARFTRAYGQLTRNSNHDLKRAFNAALNSEPDPDSNVIPGPGLRQAYPLRRSGHGEG